MLRRVGDLIAERARDKMAHSMGLLFITESIAKVKLVSKPYTYSSNSVGQLFILV